MKISILFPLMFLFTAPFLHAQKDVSKCKDHPLITRYPGAYIDWCETQEFTNYEVAIGKYTGYRAIDKWISLEGKVTRIYYVVKGDKTMSEVYQNYRNSIKKAGFEILAKGLHTQRNVSKEIGGGSWNQAAFIKNPLPTKGEINLFHGSSSSAGTSYLAAKLERRTGNVHVVLTGYQYKSDEVVFLLDAIEEAPLDDGKIDVDADYIAREIALNGSVALYGIYFDFNKSNLKPESKKNLDAIAEYLKKHPKVNLYVVGHTDMKGSLAYNMRLADARSEAVVNELVAKYRIAKNRLTGQGVGPLSPKSNNTSETGRKLNRRVELVQNIK